MLSLIRFWEIFHVFCRRSGNLHNQLITWRNRQGWRSQAQLLLAHRPSSRPVRWGSRIRQTPSTIIYNPYPSNIIHTSSNFRLKLIPGQHLILEHALLHWQGSSIIAALICHIFTKQLNLNCCLVLFRHYHIYAALAPAFWAFEFKTRHCGVQGEIILDWNLLRAWIENYWVPGFKFLL